MATLRPLLGGAPLVAPVVVIGDAARAGFDPAWMTEQLDDGTETSASTEAN